MLNEDIIYKIFPQNCGDSLKVLRKTNIKKRNKFLYECEFQKYPYKCLALKENIIAKSVLNPQIEQIEFIDKIWPQNCGDDLKIIRKSDKKQGTQYLYECEFQKYSYIIYARKEHILKGYVINPEIENQEFIGQIFPQNCGDDLKVIKKTNNKQGGNSLYECEFIKYFYRCLALKSDIKLGRIFNEKLPYLNKESLISYIQDNFKDKKPSLQEVADSLNIAVSTIGQKINEFELREYISYSYCGLENQIKDYIKSLNVDIIENYWVKDIQKEIDILVNKNFGIEVNGSYWHSNLFKNQNYHQEKSLLITKNGINLLHIFEYEWLLKKDIIKFLIKSKLGIFDKKIFARKCEVKELDYKIYSDFCNKNHLQGECGAKVKLGLFYENELVQVMSFGIPRFTDKYEWEIIRECSKLGHIIIGGKEKLWKYFIKNYNPNSVISYCDFSKFTGNSYLKLGFKGVGLNKPGFVWWDQKLNIIYQRSPWKHQEMKELGYLKIYNVGQLVFVWKVL
jgi:hypothetical protein